MLEKRFAVLIGNGKFLPTSGLSQLRCPLRDVEGWEAILLDPARGRFDEVVAVKDRPSYEILTEIHRVLRKLTKDDLFVLFYSGHGKQNLVGDLFLSASNTTHDYLASSALSVKVVRDLLNESPCRKIIFILDCCFSGAAGSAFVKSAVEDQLNVAARARGTYLLTASTAIQTALEKEEDEYSVFTKCLLNGIRTGTADYAQTGQITVEDMFQYARREVLQTSHQEPTLSKYEVHDDVIIASSGFTVKGTLDVRNTDRPAVFSAQNIYDLRAEEKKRIFMRWGMVQILAALAISELFAIQVAARSNLIARPFAHDFWISVELFLWNHPIGGLWHSPLIFLVLIPVAFIILPTCLIHWTTKSASLMGAAKSILSIGSAEVRRTPTELFAVKVDKYLKRILTSVMTLTFFIWVLAGIDSAGQTAYLQWSGDNYVFPTFWALIVISLSAIYILGITFLTPTIKGKVPPLIQISLDVLFGVIAVIWLIFMLFGSSVLIYGIGYDWTLVFDGNSFRTLSGGWLSTGIIFVLPIALVIASLSFGLPSRSAIFEVWTDLKHTISGKPPASPRGSGH